MSRWLTLTVAAMPHEIIVIPDSDESPALCPTSTVLSLLEFLHSGFQMKDWTVWTYSKQQELASAFPPGGRDVAICGDRPGVGALDSIDSAFGFLLTSFFADVGDRQSPHTYLSYSIVESPLAYAPNILAEPPVTRGCFWAEIWFRDGHTEDSDPQLLDFLSRIHSCSVSVHRRSYQDSGANRVCRFLPRPD